MTEPHTVTAAEAAHILDITPQIVASWDTRGKVDRAGYFPAPGHPVPTYKLEDLRPLAEKYHRDARTKR